jgi:hypothetical protein
MDKKIYAKFFFHLKKNLNLAILMEKQKYFFNLIAKSDFFCSARVPPNPQ